MEVPGVWEEERGSGEGLPTQMRPTDRTSRQTTADALQGLGQGNLEQDGVGRPSAWKTPGYLACGQLGCDRHVAGLPAPRSAALSWHFGEHLQAASPNVRLTPGVATPRSYPTRFFFLCVCSRVVHPLPSDSHPILHPPAWDSPSPSGSGSNSASSLASTRRAGKARPRTQPATSAPAPCWQRPARGFS